MNGIDKITQRIGADTQAEIDRILADAAAQAEAAADKFRTQAEAEDRDLLAKSERTAAEREERLVSAAQMEARKTLLTAKQEMVERAYQRALEKLRSLPQEQYVELLAALLSGDQHTFETFRCEAPELVHLPQATYEWYCRNYLDRDYPFRMLLRCNGVTFPDRKEA